MSRAGTDTLISLSELTIGSEIGHGAFSHVYRGLFRGKEVAIKKMKLADRDALKYLESELALLKNFKHDHLIRYYGAAISGKDVYIVTEFMAGGDLSSVVSKKTDVPLPWKLRCRLARDALSGIVELHGQEIVHRDIKTENILVDESWRCVVADYGFARKASRNKGTAMTICGSDHFMAPEVQFGEVYDERADVFSFGIVLWELIYRQAPGVGGFAERGPRTKFRLDVDGLRDGAPSDAPASLINLAVSCCAYEPEERISSEEALEWLEDLTREMEDSEADVPIPPVPGAATAAGTAPTSTTAAASASTASSADGKGEGVSAATAAVEAIGLSAVAASSPAGGAGSSGSDPADYLPSSTTHAPRSSGASDPTVSVPTPGAAAGGDPTRLISSPASGGGGISATAATVVTVTVSASGGGGAT